MAVAQPLQTPINDAVNKTNAPATSQLFSKLHCPKSYGLPMNRMVSILWSVCSEVMLSIVFNSFILEAVLWVPQVKYSTQQSLLLSDSDFIA